MLLLLTLDICLIIMALKMLPLQLSNQASCLLCHEKLLQLMLKLAPHLIPLLQMLLLFMLNLASYLPHHVVAVAVVVLASNIS